MNTYEQIIDELQAVKRRLHHIERLEIPRGWTYLDTPLTSTSWDGDAYSTTASHAQIDLSADFSAPAGILAVDIEVTIRDSGSATGAAAITFANSGPTPSYARAARIPQGVTNDAYVSVHMIVSCDANGDIFYRATATGAGTLDVIIRIWGYLL